MSHSLLERHTYNAFEFDELCYALGTDIQCYIRIMLTAFVGLIIGIACIIISADRFVIGASQLSQKLQWSPMLVGLTVVALGTSAPEIVVSVIAAIQGQTAMAVGNVIGSNIANISLVLGATLLGFPIIIKPHWIRDQSIILCAITLCLIGLLMDHHIGFVDAGLLISGLALFMKYLSKQHKTFSSGSDQVAQNHLSDMPWKKPLFIGLIGLPMSAQCIVYCSTIIAQSLGVSEFVIGITLVALGTSLPEMATTFSAARHQNYDLMLGNIMGSNIFNVLIVLPFAAVINPSFLPKLSFERDMLMLLLTSMVLLPYGLSQKPQVSMGRALGAGLILSYMIYLYLLIHQA